MAIYFFGLHKIGIELINILFSVGFIKSKPNSFGEC